jgi:hypothetical protein
LQKKIRFAKIFLCQLNQSGKNVMSLWTRWRKKGNRYFNFLEDELVVDAQRKKLIFAQKERVCLVK